MEATTRAASSDMNRLKLLAKECEGFVQRAKTKEGRKAAKRIADLAREEADALMPRLPDE